LHWFPPFGLVSCPLVTLPNWILTTLQGTCGIGTHMVYYSLWGRTLDLPTITQEGSSQVEGYTCSSILQMQQTNNEWFWSRGTTTSTWTWRSVFAYGTIQWTSFVRVFISSHPFLTSYFM